MFQNIKACNITKTLIAIQTNPFSFSNKMYQIKFENRPLLTTNEFNRQHQEDMAGHQLVR